MKSEPGFSTVKTSASAAGGRASAARILAASVGVLVCEATCWAAPSTGGATRDAAPAAALTAAPFRKPRRFTEPFLDLATDFSSDVFSVFREICNGRIIKQLFRNSNK